MGNSQAKKKKKEEQQLKKLEEKEKKINVAALFLAGQGIEKIPAIQKKIFLKRKGLNDQMIQEAIKRYEEKKKQKLQAGKIERQQKILTLQKQTSQNTKNNQNSSTQDKVLKEIQKPKENIEKKQSKK